MSGGHFNYDQNRISGIVDQIQDQIDNPVYSSYSKKTIKEFHEAIKVLKMAFAYSERIDWLLSGDDGEDDFHRRLLEDLSKIKDEKV